MNGPLSAGVDPVLKEAAPATAHFAYPWIPDQGDIYRNPIIHADYSDPDVVRVGDDYYLTASSFNCTPGLPVLHSRDLVNWTIIGHAVKNLPDVRYEQVQPGCGVWAPAIRFHAGKFWIFFPMPDEGIYVITAEHPAGPWTEPHCVQAGKGLIDPCPLWDDDGQAYLIHAYAGSRAGVKHRLRVCPMSPDGSKLLGEGQIVFHEPERHPIIEGPKFMKKDGWYYILAPAGGVETGWQVALRSKSIYGPYEDRIVLVQGRTAINGPHQGALVDTPDDGWWFLHFQDAEVYGRIVHLQPVAWVDGWPVMGQRGEPVLHHSKPRILPSQTICSPQTTDEFDGEALGMQWQWNANHHDHWYSMGARPGWLRLYPEPMAENLALQPNLLLQKFPAQSFLVETLLELKPVQPGEEAGIILTGNEPVTLGLSYDGTKYQMIFRGPAKTEQFFAADAGWVKLRMECRDGGKCTFTFGGANGDAIEIPGPFQATKGAWIGARMGLYSVRDKTTGIAGFADFDYFRFS